eukprot:scaffold28310_cov67-Phaeocystis_antarctica.AAC.2
MHRHPVVSVAAVLRVRYPVICRGHSARVGRAHAVDGDAAVLELHAHVGLQLGGLAPLVEQPHRHDQVGRRAIVHAGVEAELPRHGTREVDRVEDPWRGAAQVGVELPLRPRAEAANRVAASDNLLGAQHVDRREDAVRLKGARAAGNVAIRARDATRRVLRQSARAARPALRQPAVRREGVRWQLGRVEPAPAAGRIDIASAHDDRDARRFGEDALQLCGRG